MKILIGVLLLSSCSMMPSQKAQEKKTTKAKESKKAEITYKSVSHHIENWPEAPKAAANSMISKYGLPNEVSASHIIWMNTAPFKRSIVYKDEIHHNFPMPHSDVLEQVIDYRVPATKVGSLVKFDGSLVVDRTKGELSSRNDKEEMNLLALNLADEIIQGEVSVDQARQEFARSAQAFSLGNTNQYTTSLNFRPDSETADADMALQRSMRKNNDIEAQEAPMEAEEAQE